ncbi:hypothetical protein OIE67_16805 [Nonomuraea fuscirosea]|uniref:hypothetical protein n=1 Tax=Nonomuraea fuscirosea TaxID=1291556 RepID=UPI002DDA1521|nr:hypothetical protein [Nonomuraea fuscirosea]WSA56198.1 hypothetical protein OIE67_16805 [Nonomuraea fuscirosea]
MTATPLGLWLLRMVYILSNADPAPLLGPLGHDSKALRHHLLDHLVGALIHARLPTTDPSDPFLPRRAWDPGEVRAWLGHLAQALTRHRTRDLAWWHVARYTTSPVRRRLLQVAVGFLVGLGVAMAVAISLTGTSDPVDEIAGAALGLIAWIRVGDRVGNWFEEAPGYTNRRLILRRFGGVGLGLAVAVVGLPISAVPMALSLPHQYRYMVGVVALLCIVLGLIGGSMIIRSAWSREMELPTPLTSSASAASTWRADRTLTVARVAAPTCTFGVMVFLLFAVIGILDGDPVTWIQNGLVYGLTPAFIGGFVYGLVSGHHHAWLACELTLLTQRRLPRKLIPFLDDMHRLGLLRSVGPLYQFRHAELHNHLARTARPGG